MAIYAVECLLCGERADQWQRMPPHGGLPQLDPCECGGAVKKLVTRVSEVGTGNRMHHIIDNQLVPQAGPAVFNTRADWQAEMKRRGVRPMEAGEARDAARLETERSVRLRAEFQKKLEEKIEKSIDKAIETIGGA